MKSISSHFEFSFEKGEHKGENYHVNMSVLCQNPLCRCTDMLFGISDGEDFENSKFQYLFYLDIIKKKLKKHGTTGADRITKNFSKSFISAMQDKDWEYFLQYFRSYKVHQIGNIENIDDLEHDFSSTESDIESNSTMVINR